MKALNLSHINLISPYTVWNTTSEYYFFKTDSGAVFKIGFMDDYSVWQKGAYQFLIINESDTPSPLDNKLRDTVFCIISAFFEANPEILLYICETGDGKQELRSRLFVRWFNSYAYKNDYVLETAEVQEGKTKNFAALIVQKSNPRLTEILREFRNTI